MNSILDDLNESIKKFNINRSEESFNKVVEIVMALLNGEGFIYIPVGISEETVRSIKNNGVFDKDKIHINDGASFELRKIISNDNKGLLPCFTDKKKYRPTPRTALIFSSFKQYLDMAKAYSDIDGIVINPFTDPIVFTKEIIEGLLNDYERNKTKNYS